MDGPPRTYLLAPNLTFLPDGPLALGNVIANPLKPHRSLARLPPDRWPATAEALEAERRVVRARSTKAHLALTADLSAVLPAGAHVGARNETTVTREYSMDSLRTVYFTADPAPDVVKTLVMDNLVRYALDRNWSKSVYMVNGVKIARGLVSRDSTTRARGGDAGVRVDVAPGLSVGVDTGLERSEHQEDSGESQQEVVLAYQLLRIARKGWLKRRLDIDGYKPKDGFLSDTVSDESAAASDLDAEVEVQLVIEGDLLVSSDLDEVEAFYIAS